MLSAVDFRSSDQTSGGQESDLLIDWYRKADSNVDLAEKGNTIII